MSRFESYRSNLAKDLHEVRKDDRDGAKKILEEEKNTTRYNETESVQAEKRNKTQDDFKENQGLGRDFALATQQEQEQYDTALSDFESNPDVVAYLEAESGIQSTNSTIHGIESNMEIAQAEYQEANQKAEEAREQARLATSTVEYGTGPSKQDNMIKDDLAEASKVYEQLQIKSARVKELQDAIDRVVLVRNNKIAQQQPHTEAYQVAKKSRDEAQQKLSQAKTTFRQQKVDEVWNMQNEEYQYGNKPEGHKYIERLTGKSVGVDVINYGTIRDAINQKIDEGARTYKLVKKQEQEMETRTATKLADEAQINEIRDKLQPRS